MIAGIAERNMYLAYRGEGAFDRAGRLEGLDNPFAPGPVMKFIRRFGWMKTMNGNP